MVQRVVRIVDSLLRAAPEGTPAYGDALFWRGALAETAADAERDYRRVIVEYPLSPYSDDALLSLAELEQARGDRAAAYQHLQRFVREHPASPARARAGLAAARLAFEQRDNASRMRDDRGRARIGGNERRRAAQSDRVLRWPLSAATAVASPSSRADLDAERHASRRIACGTGAIRGAAMPTPRATTATQRRRTTKATERFDAACERRRTAAVAVSTPRRGDDEAGECDGGSDVGETTVRERHRGRQRGEECAARDAGPSSSPRTTPKPMRNDW